jgi:glycosyltransferase involved in cell wall biosynthesis
VIGFDRGSVREVVADGETGFVVTSVNAAAEAVGQVERIDRQECRHRVEQLFSVDSMVTGYVSVYEQILEKR